DEWVRAVKSLWDTWEPGSLVLDEATNTFADPTKVHHANFDGQFYKTRGPLNTVPSPQGHPVICQAGGSPAGMAFGAKHADTILASVDGPEAMRKYREDIHARMVQEGRDPSSVKILFLVDPILADTDAEADERRRRRDEAAVTNVDAALMRMSYISGLDWSKYDLDAPIPDIDGKHNGHQSVVDDFVRAAKGKTLREALAGQRRGTESVDIWGSPATVAAKMDEVMQEAGGDGFLIALPVTRKNITEVCDGLAPELRRRGLIRDGYEFDTFRENLFAF
ncbi:MAG: LLM class flavin-dependent oxidoreductase, partial [Curtobacterium sp.]